MKKGSYFLTDCRRGKITFISFVEYLYFIFDGRGVVVFTPWSAVFSEAGSRWSYGGGSIMHFECLHPIARSANMPPPPINVIGLKHSAECHAYGTHKNCEVRFFRMIRHLSFRQPRLPTFQPATGFVSFCGKEASNRRVAGQALK